MVSTKFQRFLEPRHFSTKVTQNSSSANMIPQQWFIIPETSDEEHD